MQRLAQKWGNPEDEKKRATGAAKLALQTGKDNPFALAAAGMALGWAGDVDEAQAVLDRSLELNANSALAWSAKGYVSTYVGKLSQSIDCFQRAIRLSPLDLFAYSFYGGIAIPYFFLKQYDLATHWADKALALEPNFTMSLVTKVISAAMAGDEAALRASLERLTKAVPDASVSRLMAFHGSRVPDQRAFTELALRRAGFPE